MANFNLSGKTPVSRAALHICVKGEKIYGELNVIMRLEISSYPAVFVVFMD